MRFGILGPLEVRAADGAPITIPERKVRGLLADLLVHRGSPVPADRLVEDLWPGRSPANPAGVLRSKISQLRSVLEAAEPGARTLVAHQQPGYLLRCRPGTVDADDFEDLLTRAYRSRDRRTRAILLSDALALWRGPALADFADEEFVRTWVGGLEERRLSALEELTELRLDLGERGLLIGELAELVKRYPSRERFRSVQLRALYRAGRQGEALDAYRELHGHLRDTLGIEPSPELAELHLAILNHDPALAADSGPPSTPSNLPTPLTGLVGRERAVAETGALLAEHRVLTLVGPGGVGKTRLALAAAGRLAGEFPDGSWLIELAGLELPDAGRSDQSTSSAEALARVAERVAGVLGVRDESPPGGQPVAAGTSAADRLAAVLSGRRMLLILDNCEHLIEPAAELVRQLLQAAAGVRILATSREPLGIFGERLVPVPPLRVPGPELTDQDLADLAPTELAGYSAIEMFVARAAESAPGFALTAERVPAVATICRRLDGIPLALELAATRVRSLGVRQLAERLDDRFQLLASGERGAPARQRTLRAVIDWSWELLTDHEQLVLRRLAVQSGGCTAEAAEQVCGVDELPAGEVLDAVSRLVDRSLVVMTEEADGPRYRLLESVLAYASERLQESGEAEEVRDRHARYYLDFVERADPQLRGHGQRRWLRRLDAETANLQAALEVAIRQQDAGLALRLTCAQSWYWVLRGRLDEGARALARALAVPGPMIPGLRRTATTWHTAICALAGREPDPAGRLADDPVAPVGPADPAGAAEDPTALVRAQGLLAVVTPRTVDPASGLDLVDHCLAVSRALGYRWGVAAALSTRAWDALMRSEFDQLRRDAEQSAALFEELGDQWGVLHATDPLAALARIRGDLAAARSYNLNGLRVAQDLGLWPKVAQQLCELGQIALLTGELTEAEEAYERARKLAADQSNLVLEQAAELGLATCARRRGELDQAEKRLLPWLDWSRQVGWDAGIAAILAELGFVAESRSDPAGCLLLHQEGYRRARAAGEPLAIAQALDGLAAGYALAGEYARAGRLLGAAEVVRAQVGMPQPAAERSEVERIAALVGGQLGPDGLATELERGRHGDPDQHAGLDGDRSSPAEPAGDAVPAGDPAVPAVRSASPARSSRR